MSSAFEQTIQELISGKRWDTPDPDNFSPDQFTSFAEFGIHFHSHRALSQQQIEQRFNEVRSWMSSFLTGAQSNALYMDTTTLCAVERLTELTGEIIVCSPSALLDLSNFVNAIVLYDHVFHLENSSLDSIKINEALGNEPIVISLPVSSFKGGYHGDEVTSLGAILRGLWYTTKNYMEELRLSNEFTTFGEDAEEIKKAWLNLIEVSPDSDQWFHWKAATDNYDSDGPALLESLVGTFSGKLGWW